MLHHPTGMKSKRGPVEFINLSSWQVNTHKYHEESTPVLTNAPNINHGCCSC
jgi:hypothetical protein